MTGHFRRNVHPPRWLDLPLRGLKYLLLGVFLWAISSMSAVAIEQFMRSPYGIIAEVKMLNFFRHIGETGFIVLGVLLVASVFVQNFWCRYLCPYGALLGLAALFSPIRIRRSPSACIDCRKCARACPSALAIDQLVSIKSAECTACLECVAVCPAEGALQLAAPGWVPKEAARVSSGALAAGIAAVLLGIIGAAKLSGHWDSPIPRSAYVEIVPRADQASHPMPGN